MKEVQCKEKEGSVQFENVLLTYQLKMLQLSKGHDYSISKHFQSYIGNSRSFNDTALWHS